MLVPLTTLSLLALLLEANAIRMEGRRSPTNNKLRRRNSAKFAGDFGSESIGNTQDVNYNINMTIGTEQRTVTIDTGRSDHFSDCRLHAPADSTKNSSDLWTIGTIENTKTTGFSGSITYAQGSAKGDWLFPLSLCLTNCGIGPIFLTDIEFAGHKVTNQAYSKPHTPLRSFQL